MGCPSNSLVYFVFTIALLVIYIFRTTKSYLADKDAGLLYLIALRAEEVNQ